MVNVGSAHRFDGRVAIVTGASRGIGSALAQRLGAGGAAVVVAARTETAGGRLEGSIREVEQLIREAGGTCLAVACDVADPAACADLVRTARDAFGPVDILVNNAALTIPERSSRPKEGPRLSVADALSVVNFPLEAYRHAFEVNLFSVYRLIQLVAPEMIRRGAGNIVNISSDAAQSPGEGPYPRTPGIPMHAYGTSKAALEHLTRTVGYELARHGIAVNAVLPSLTIETPGSVFASGGQVGDTLPMGRFVDAVEVLCGVSCVERTGSVVHSEDLLDPGAGRRGWLGEPYL